MLQSGSVRFNWFKHQNKSMMFKFKPTLFQKAKYYSIGVF